MTPNREPRYRVEENGAFVIENYAEAKPFSNFLPSIAGPFGIPLWAFYVNRGQGIASFGVEDKDHAIMQFYPANRSYEMTALRGFRTFIKVVQGKKSAVYEPFRNSLENFKNSIAAEMQIQSDGFSLIENNPSLHLKTRVQYFGIPNENFAALARVVTIENTKNSPIHIECIDGLPIIVPFGLKEFFLKDMSRTVEAWMVSEIASGSLCSSFFKLKADPEDRPEFKAVDGAHFYAAKAFYGDKKTSDISGHAIVDPDAVFGNVQDFSDARVFGLQTPYRAYEEQILQNKTPCAMSSFKARIKGRSQLVILSLIGETKDKEKLQKRLTHFMTLDYFRTKDLENQSLIRELGRPLKTISNRPSYNRYCEQTFLDNVLRGGYPHVIPAGENDFVFNVYSRKHGDLVHA